MLELNLTKNTNSNIQAQGYNPVGKYYARVEPKQMYDVEMLAEHMHGHNSSFSKGLITGVLTDMVTCIKELVLEGNSVKIPNLGIFKASIEANGLTLSRGAKITAGRGSQRTDAELSADITKQQSAVRSVKLIMQATGDTTKDDLTNEAKLTFTSKAKELVKSETGDEATDNTGSNGGSSNGGSNSGSGTGNITPGGGDNGGGGNGGGGFESEGD